MFKAITNQASTKDENITTNKKKKKKMMISSKKSKILTADGISLEAFQLSDQANVLYEKGILPMKKSTTSSRGSGGGSGSVKGHSKQGSSSFDSYSSKLQAIAARATSSGIGGSSRSACSSSSGGGGGESTVGSNNNIQLTSEILIQNTDVTEVDPMLLAVPLPITPLIHSQSTGTATTTTNKRGTGTGKATTTHSNKKSTFSSRSSSSSSTSATPFTSNLPPLPEFEHSFPSEYEQTENPQIARLAKLHFAKILNTMTTTSSSSSLLEVKARMRDPHFLQYLHKHTVLDKITKDSLGKCLVDNSEKFPGLVKVALDMLKMTLDGGGSSSKSNAKNSIARRSGRLIEDDEDDDDNEDE